jgi:hypothetical protein
VLGWFPWLKSATERLRLAGKQVIASLIYWLFRLNEKF